jgi:hypothetical protein
VASLYVALAFRPAQGSQESDSDVRDFIRIDGVTALIGVKGGVWFLLIYSHDPGMFGLCS